MDLIKGLKLLDLKGKKPCITFMQGFLGFWVNVSAQRDWI
jgi:hypothetical protein